MSELFSHPYRPEPQTTSCDDASKPVQLPVFSDRADQRARSH